MASDDQNVIKTGTMVCCDIHHALCWWTCHAESGEHAEAVEPFPDCISSNWTLPGGWNAIFAVKVTFIMTRDMCTIDGCVSLAKVHYDLGNCVSRLIGSYLCRNRSPHGRGQDNSDTSAPGLFASTSFSNKLNIQFIRESCLISSLLKTSTFIKKF